MARKGQRKEQQVEQGRSPLSGTNHSNSEQFVPKTGPQFALRGSPLGDPEIATKTSNDNFHTSVGQIDDALSDLSAVDNLDVSSPPPAVLRCCCAGPAKHSSRPGNMYALDHPSCRFYGSQPPIYMSSTIIIKEGYYYTRSGMYLLASKYLDHELGIDDDQCPRRDNFVRRYTNKILVQEGRVSAQQHGWDLVTPLVSVDSFFCVLRGTIVSRTYGIHKNLYMYPFLLTIFGPINYGPPQQYILGHYYCCVSPPNHVVWTLSCNGQFVVVVNFPPLKARHRSRKVYRQMSTGATRYLVYGGSTTLWA